MHYLAQFDSESLDDFFDRVYSMMRVADNNGEKRPRLAKLYRARYNEYLLKRRQNFAEKVENRFMREGAGTRQKIKGKSNYTTALDENGNEMRDSEGRLIIKTFRHNPGSQGGRSSTYRSKDCRERYLLEANDIGYCRACKKKIWTDKAKVLCVDPQSITRKYVAVICKSCSQGENIIMHTRAGNDVWIWIHEFKDAQVRAWCKFKLATLPEDKLDKFRAYVLSLPWEIRPMR